MQEIQVLEEVSSDPNELKKQFYIESYGCAMNFSDSEIIGSILTEHGFTHTNDEFEVSNRFFSIITDSTSI